MIVLDPVGSSLAGGHELAVSLGRDCLVGHQKGRHYKLKVRTKATNEMERGLPDNRRPGSEGKRGERCAMKVFIV